jgi:DNA-directed RNA polymerase subunit D
MAMKLEKIKEERKKNKITFLFKGSDEVFANTIRRTIIEEVPVLAVEDLEIKENNCALYDEMLGLRIGLCPVKTDLKSYNLKDECKCEGAGCAQCELKMHLKASKKGYVYAKDTQSSDPKCTFVYDEMPLAKLLSKQKVDIQMTAIMGKGRDHAKWIPGLAFFKKEPVIKIGNVKDAEGIAAACPQNVFNAKSGKLTVNKDNLYDCHLCNQCVDLDKNITLEDSGDFIFSLESWGQLNNKEILTQSAKILLEKIDNLEKQI